MQGVAALRDILFFSGVGWRAVRGCSAVLECGASINLGRAVCGQLLVHLHLSSRLGAAGAYPTSDGPGGPERLKLSAKC